MDSQVFTKTSCNVSDEDVGTMSKKKKESENRTSANSDVVFFWDQKDYFVNISLITTSGHDENKAQVAIETNHVSVTLADGRRFSTKLYGKIEPEGCETLKKGNKFILRLMKHDPDLHWPSLMPPESPPNKNCQHSSLSNNNSNSEPPNAKFILEKDSNIEQESNNMAPPKKVVQIKEDRFKTDFSERNEANSLIFYMYIKQIFRESVKVEFFSRKVVIQFSCNDIRLLNMEPDWNSCTVFLYELQLLGDIVVESGSYQVSPTKLELKMKKVKPGMWQAVSPVSAPPAAVKGKSWEVSMKGNSVPQPPPAPPTPLQPRKPTCQVSPSPSARSDRGFNFGSSSSSSSYGSGALTSYGSSETLPGYMGLENIGNTCFMNSVLQTLLNTRELRDYFLSPQNYYQKEMNKNNPLGQGGKLAVAFAVLMKVAWINCNRSFAPTKLKAVMSLKANQFSGFAQHDAQELMVEMLDGLHEDLNRVKEKPYCAEPPELDGWSDVDAAAEAWRLHKLRNDSVIDDLFKGQFRSALTCHECGKISVKFDEFCCLSVPIPKDQKVIEVTFFYKLGQGLRRPVKLRVRVSADALLEDLKREIGLKVNVNPACIVILEVYKHRVQKIFENGSSVESIEANDVLLAFEVLIPEQVGGEEVVQVCVTQRLSAPPLPSRCSNCGRAGDSELRINRCQACLSVGYCSRECQKSHSQLHMNSCHRTREPVGAPFIVSLLKSHATYENLARAMEGYARHSVEVFQPPVASVAHGPGARGQPAAARGGAVRRARPARRVGSTSSCESSDDDAERDQCESMEVEIVSRDELSAEEAVDLGLVEEEEVFSECRSQLPPAASDLPLKPPPTTGVCAVPPHLESATAASQLFTIVPVNCRGLSLANKVPLADLGSEPLDLENSYHLAMDWKTDTLNTNDVVCFINNKEIECTELERGASGSTGPHGHGGRQSTTLQACMDLFTQPENLSEGDSWRCPRCKKPVEATKQMSLWRLPPVLIVQLKRFSFKYVLYSDKIDKFIKYPINGFDVGAHIAPGGGDGRSTLYDLYGVVNHMGRLLGGHYTAYTRTLRENSTESEIGWRLCDDSRVMDMSPERVVSDQAYLLLYRRRDTPFVLPPLPVEAPADVVPTPVAPLNSNLMATDDPPQLDNASFDARAASPSVVRKTRSSVVHVPGAPLASAVTVSPAPSSGIANFEVPHSNLHNMSISKQGPYDPRHVTTISTDNSGASVNAGGLAAPPASPLHSGNVTSTINTNDAVCGNLVSNINIDDMQSGTFVPACTTASFIPTLPATNFAGAQVEPGFGSSMASSVARPMYIAGLNADNRNLGSFPTVDSCVPDATVLNNRNGVFSGSGYVLGRGSGTVESTPSDGGACLDEVTPMSVSSASQPSLSSTEEESISTAQEELD